MSESLITPQTFDTNIIPMTTAPDAASESSWRPFSNMSRKAAAFLSGMTVASFVAPAAVFADGGTPVDGGTTPSGDIDPGLGINPVVGHIGAISLSVEAKKKTPTGSASALHSSSEADDWGKNVVAPNCPGEFDVWATAGHGSKHKNSRIIKLHRHVGTMTITETDHLAYTLRVHDGVHVCATEGITNNKKQFRFNPMHFIHRKDGYKVYEFTDTEHVNSDQAIFSVGVATN